MYERIASLSYRQTLGANKLAWYDGAFNASSSPPQPHLWVKGCGSSGDTGKAVANCQRRPSVRPVAIAARQARLMTTYLPFHFSYGPIRRWVEVLHCYDFCNRVVYLLFAHC